MYFSRPDHAPAQDLQGRLAIAFVTVVFLILGVVTMDVAMRANGLYGERVFAAETVTEKRIRISGGRSRSRNHDIHFLHRGVPHVMTVLSSQYEKIAVGDRIKMIIVPGRFAEPTVFLDTPGLKLDPQTRVVAYGLIIAVHFGGLFLLFHGLLARARNRESGDAAAFQARRLGLRPRA